MALTPANQPPISKPLLDTADAAQRSSLAPAASEPTKVGQDYIWLVVIAQFGGFMALVTPIAISLAIRVAQLAPGHEEYLGYVTGAGSIAALLSGPVVGRLSDRTRSRFGRRRPFLLGGTLLGMLALLLMAQASSLVVLGLGWVLVQVGWGAALGMLVTSQADRLPEAQRGKVSGLAGVVTQLAPIAGVLFAGGAGGNNLLLFLVPGAVGVVGMTLFACLVREPDSRHLTAAGKPLTVRSLARSYVFNPRQNPDFAWNWLGRFMFMFGVTFNTTFTAFFLASRMGTSVAHVASTVAALGGGSVVTAMLGAIGGGFLSDRLHRRRVFVLIGACVFAVGVIVMALSASVPVIMAGAIAGNFGIGLFSAVDQALFLDVLPDRESDAGRYGGIYGFSNTIPQGVAPFIAPLFLAIDATGGQQDYTLLYLIAAACTVAGGLVVVLRVKSVR